MHALSLVDLADLLPFYILSIPAEGFHPAFLDQHGRHGDLHANGHDIDRSRVTGPIFERAASVPKRVHDFLLGYGHLVDTDARGPGLLGACNQEGR